MYRVDVEMEYDAQLAAQHETRDHRIACRDNKQHILSSANRGGSAAVVVLPRRLGFQCPVAVDAVPNSALAVI